MARLCSVNVSKSLYRSSSSVLQPLNGLVAHERRTVSMAEASQCILVYGLISANSRKSERCKGFPSVASSANMLMHL
eukprot:7383392-Prymnesium_polylepis.2